VLTEARAAVQWWRNMTVAQARRESRGEHERAQERGETGVVKAGAQGALL
jgi:hypothetical protein